MGVGAGRVRREGVFVSYSHEDKGWLDKLWPHLRPLERDFKVEVWADTKIRAGAAWKEELLDALDRAGAAVLLVSANFFASDFITGEELPRLVKAAEVEGTRVLPVILGPCRYERTPLSRFQSVNPPDRPLNAMKPPDREAVFDRLAAEIESTLLPRRAMGDLAAGVAVMNKAADAYVPGAHHRMTVEATGARVTTTWEGRELQTITEADFKSLPKDVLRHVSNLSKRMEAHYAQWEAAVGRMAEGAGGAAGRRLEEEELEFKVKVAADLRDIVNFFVSNGMQLDDHYLMARSLAEQVAGAAPPPGM